MLRTQYASQLHVNPTLSVNYFFLNTRLRPFDDVRVRRAVNYAVDENRFVELQGGPYFAQPACDVLPPNLVGYRRYCPYTIHPTPGGPYNGPDLAKARQLVAASGTGGSTVTVWATKGNQTWLRDAPYLVSVLSRLGYKTRLRLIPDKTYFPTTSDSRSKIQTAPAGWYADYPSPSNFIPAQLSCAQYQAASRSNHNVSAFCNPHIDALIARAGTLQTTDPHAAAALWAKIDDKIVDQAPWVMLPSTGAADFVSSKVGNYTYSPWVGALLDELSVR